MNAASFPNTQKLTFLVFLLTGVGWVVVEEGKGARDLEM